MTYFYLLTVLIIGIGVGVYFAKQKGMPLSEQSKKKAENKESVLKMLSEKGRVTNDDVENLLGVSDATATRYLDELEKEGKVRQVGVTGQAVYYELI